MTEKIVWYNPVPVAGVAQEVFQPYPKLDRFQRTNHGWTDGIYDDSLPISHRERVAGAIRRLFLPNQPVNKKQFTHEKFLPTHNLYYFLTNKCQGTINRES